MALTAAVEQHLPLALPRVGEARTPAEDGAARHGAAPTRHPRQPEDTGMGLTTRQIFISTD